MAGLERKVEIFTSVALAALQTLIHACGVFGIRALLTRSANALLLVTATLLFHISACEWKKQCDRH